MKQEDKSWFVSQLNIFDRVDPLFYRPKIVLLRNKISEKNGCSIRDVGKVKGGYAFKSNTFNVEGSSIPVIKIGEIGEGFVDLSNASLVAPDYLERFKAYKGKRGLSVVALTGATIGKASIISEHDLPCLINQRVGIVQSIHVNKYYMAAFLNSSASKMQIETIGSGAAQANLSTEQVESVLIPIPDKVVQSFIGQKIELAEKCRKEATACLNSAKNALEDALRVNVFSSVVPKISSRKPLKITSVKPSCSIVYPDFIKGVMGAHAYAAVHAQVELNLKHEGVKQVSLGSIVKEMVNGYDCRDFSETGTAYAKVAELKAGRLIPNPKQFVSIPLSDVPQKQRVKRGDLLVTRKGSFGICANATKEDEAVIISSEIIRLRLVDKYDSAYVSLFLNSNYGRSKFDRLATGTMMLGINHGNLSEIEIPILDPAIQKKIGDKCRVWQSILKKSEALVQSAKSDVEALIEGKLDVVAILSGKLKAPTWEDIEKELEGI